MGRPIRHPRVVQRQRQVLRAIGKSKEQTRGADLVRDALSAIGLLLSGITFGLLLAERLSETDSGGDRR